MFRLLKKIYIISCVNLYRLSIRYNIFQLLSIIFLLDSWIFEEFLFSFKKIKFG